MIPILREVSSARLRVRIRAKKKVGCTAKQAWAIAIPQGKSVGSALRVAWVKSPRGAKRARGSRSPHPEPPGSFSCLHVFQPAREFRGIHFLNGLLPTV